MIVVCRHWNALAEEIVINVIGRVGKRQLPGEGLSLGNAYLSLPMSFRTLSFFLLGAAACSGSDRPPPCGLNAVVGPAVLLGEFSKPGQTLASPPAQLPERIVTRLVAGPAFSAIAGRAEGQWVIGVNGTLPPNAAPTFGVLILDTTGTPLGVLLYESAAVEGAPQIGTVTAGAIVVPLVGIQLDPERIQDPTCPLFPDSLAQ